MYINFLKPKPYLNFSLENFALFSKCLLYKYFAKSFLYTAIMAFRLLFLYIERKLNNNFLIDLFFF